MDNLNTNQEEKSNSTIVIMIVMCILLIIVFCILSIWFGSNKDYTWGVLSCICCILFTGMLIYFITSRSGTGILPESVDKFGASLKNQYQNYSQRSNNYLNNKYGAIPQGQMIPGQMPSGQMMPGQMPSGQMMPGQMPSGQ